MEELLNYIEQTDPVRAELAYKDCLSSEVEKRKHISNLLTGACTTLSEIRQEAFTDSLFKILTDSFKNKLEKILKGYNVFINNNNGYTFDSLEYESYTLLDYKEKDKIIFPLDSMKDVRFIKWENGSHWYAKIGNIDIIDEYGNQKWNTKKEAEKAVKEFLENNKI